MRRRYQQREAHVLVGVAGGWGRPIAIRLAPRVTCSRTTGMFAAPLPKTKTNWKKKSIAPRGSRYRNRQGEDAQEAHHSGKHNEQEQRKNKTSFRPVDETGLKTTKNVRHDHPQSGSGAPIPEERCFSKQRTWRKCRGGGGGGGGAAARYRAVHSSLCPSNHHHAPHAGLVAADTNTL